MSPQRTLRSVRFTIEFTNQLSDAQRDQGERETSSSLADLLHLDEPDLHGDHPLRPPDRTQLSDAAKFGAAEQVSV